MGSQKTPTKIMEAAEKKKATRNSKSKTMRKGITENQSPNGFSHHQEHKQENSQRQWRVLRRTWACKLKHQPWDQSPLFCCNELEL